LIIYLFIYLFIPFQLLCGSNFAVT